MPIGINTIHFDDSPWSVRCFYYETSQRLRYLVTIPEDLIFAEKKQSTLTQEEMVTWAKENIDQLTKSCDELIRRRVDAGHPLQHNDEIIIARI